MTSNQRGISALLDQIVDQKRLDDKEICAAARRLYVAATMRSFNMFVGSGVEASREGWVGVDGATLTSR